MNSTRVSVLNRVLYFTIPEQKIVYNAMKMYLERHPESLDAKGIRDDFYRETFEQSHRN